MVREQEPSRVLSPSEANIPLQTKPPSKQDQPEIGPRIRENNYGVPHSTSLAGGSLDKSAAPNSSRPRIAPAQPEFGRPTALGSPLQPHRAPHPASQRNNSGSTGRAGAASDPYSNLFISANSTLRRPEHHKPPPQNPLLQAHRLVRKSHDVLPQPKTASAHDTSSLRPGDVKLGAVPVRVPTNDDLMEIPRPINFPTVAARPPVPPTFSSHTTSNPYYASRNFVDLATNAIGMATNKSLSDDRFGASDPYVYVDAAKANENIKQLLEGAFEDEDDKPRTRRRQKDRQLNANDLAEKLDGMNVSGKEEDGDDEQDGEEDDGTVEGLKVKLLPHQIDGVAWMRDKELGKKKTRGVFPKGGILADDMGLGKTIQSIALMLTNPKPLNTTISEDLKTSGDKEKRKLSPGLDGGTLVVAPLALIRQWEGEIKNRVEDTHTLRVCVHHGPQRAKSSKELKKYDVVITTYHTLVSEHGSSEGTVKVGCFGLHWYRIILDEAHSIKNRNAKATKAACTLNAEYRWCLTGTPMQNNLDELQSLIHFLRIKPYDDLNQWREGITRPMSNGQGGLAIKRLQVYLKAFMKRRTKDVLKQDGALKYGEKAGQDLSKPNAFNIVKRTVQKIEMDFAPEERAFYKRLEMRADKSLEQMMAGNKVSYASALVLLLRLRQACNHPRLVKSDLAKERDAFTNGSGSQTPSRKKASNEDVDSIAEMLGGLSVATKRCDVCQIELSAKETSIGAIRCTDCEADLENENVKPKSKALPSKKKKSQLKENHRRDQSKRKLANRRIIDDSDDENAETDSDGDDEGVRPRRRQPDDLVSLVTDEEGDSDSSSLVRDSEEDVENGDDDEEDGVGSEDVADDLIMSTKIRYLLSILKRDASKHKYIVFSFFTSMLDLIEPFLRQEGLVYTRYDGAMRNDLREASLERLRSHAKTRILLCSLRAGSLGLNLTAASRVVILEPFWNPFVEEQAIDRVHRLNQTQDVVVYKMTVKDTVEARILDLQERKRELANATIEGKSAAAKLTLQDMLKLFRHDAEHLHGVDGIGLGKARLLVGDRQQSQEESQSRREGSGGLTQPTKRKEHEVYGRRW
jgi:SNF2 family DNA or RNA helicase